MLLIGDANLNEIEYYNLNSLNLPQKEKGKYDEIIAKVIKNKFSLVLFHFSILNLPGLLFFTKKTSQISQKNMMKNIIF